MLLFQMKSRVKDEILRVVLLIFFVIPRPILYHNLSFKFELNFKCNNRKASNSIQCAKYEVKECYFFTEYFLFVAYLCLTLFLQFVIIFSVVLVHNYSSNIKCESVNTNHDNHDV